MTTVTFVYKGGPGSGHHGHRGRPGKVGGSLPEGSQILGDFIQTDNIPDAPTYGPFGTDYGLYASALYSMTGHLVGDDRGEYEINADVTYRNALKTYADAGEYHSDKGFYISTAPNVDWRPGGMYMTAEQRDYILADMKKTADLRREFINRELQSLPEDFHDVFGVDLVFAKDAYAAGVSEDYYTIMNGFNEHVMYLLRDVDMTQFSSGELKNYIGDRYEEQAKAVLGEDSQEFRNFQNWMYQALGEVEDYHEFQVMRAVSAGDITPQYGDKSLGVFAASHPWSDVTWQPLPNELYHATTNSSSIVNDMIRSRMELGGRKAEIGLGGGESNTISFANDKMIAKDIERSLHEAYLVASGKVSFRDLFQIAHDGGGNNGKNWLPMLMEATIGDYAKTHPKKDRWTADDFDPAEDLPGKFADIILAEDAGGTSSIPMDNIREKIWDLYHLQWSRARQQEGGFMDPVFFGTNWKQLAKANPFEFKVHKYKPRTSRVRGYQLNSLGEWRIVGGDNVVLEEVLDFYDPRDRVAILGL